MDRIDVVELVVDIGVDLVDVDLAGSLCDGPRSVLFSFGLVAPTSVSFTFGPDLFYFGGEPLLYLLLTPICFIFFGPDLSFILILAKVSPLQFYQLPCIELWKSSSTADVRKGQIDRKRFRDWQMHACMHACIDMICL